MGRHFLILLFFLPNLVFSQYQFQFKNDVPLTINGSSTGLSWSGGLNSGQFQKLDLNGDGIEDLVIYHRMSQQVATFLTVNNEYIFSPDFAALLPKEINEYLIIKDFDCDGLKDIFTSTPFGIKVFKNISTGAGLQWELAAEVLQFDSGINIQVNSEDIPGIEDIDGDGDLDILTYRFTNSSTIDYYRNTSIENTNACGELTFTRDTRVWGDFEECSCNDIVFESRCITGGTANNDIEILAPEGIEHAGGKTILAIDMDNDGDMDLITSDESCETLYYMENVGDSQTARMTSFSSFPDFDPAAFYIFPSAFFDDFDFDGIKDLVISSNSGENVLNSIDFTNNTKIYKNTGSNTDIIFANAVPFLQDKMLDLGELTYPSLVDFDADGDQDLIVGNRGLVEANNFIASLFLFENQGTQFEPNFILVNDDYLVLKSSEYRNIKPQFVDLDGDGDTDLSYQATTTNGQTSIFYRINSGGHDKPILLGNEQVMLNSQEEADQPFFYDVDNNGKVDLLLGKRLGALHLLENDGNLNFSEVTTTYADLTDDFDRRNLVPSVTDIDNDGRSELITTDYSGEIRIHSGTLGRSFVPDSVSYELINNQHFDTPITSSNGLISPITFGDLLGTGKPLLIQGNNRGGLHLLENLSERGINNSSLPIVLNLFPNPSSVQFTIRTDVQATLDIYSVTGQLVNSGISIAANINLEFNSTGMAPGIYLVRAYNGNNKPTVKRLLIFR